MKSENFNQDSADDGLYIDGDTSIDEIKEFLKNRAENPVVIDGTVIWDFCGYERNEEALERAVRNKLRGDRYIIPFQVTGTWGLMYHLLPESLKDGEILVYDPRQETYKGYRNFARDIAREQEDAFRQDLARRVADAEPEPLTFD